MENARNNGLLLYFITSIVMIASFAIVLLTS